MCVLFWEKHIGLAFIIMVVSCDCNITESDVTQPLLKQLTPSNFPITYINSLILLVIPQLLVAELKNISSPMKT